MHKRYEMPTRIAGVVDPFEVDDGTLLVGKCIVAGVGFMVGLQLGGMAMMMRPGEAREMANEFATGMGKAAGLEWVATALCEAADEIDAMPDDGRLQ